VRSSGSTASLLSLRIPLGCNKSGSRLPSWKGFIPVWCSLNQKSIGICIERVQAIKEEWRGDDGFASGIVTPPPFLPYPPQHE
jgi:hypothetical protein